MVHGLAQQVDIEPLGALEVTHPQDHVINVHSTELRGGGWHHSAKAARGEDLDIEEPVACRYASAHFHTTLPSMLGSMLIRDEIIQMCEPREKRLLAPCLDDGTPSSRITSARWRCGPDPAACWSRASAGRRGPHTSPPLCPGTSAGHAPVGVPCAVRHVVNKVAEPLSQGKHAQAFALACSIQQGVELRS